MFFYLQYLSKRLVLGILRLYQYTLSCDHGLMRYWYPGGCCKFLPTCSEYAYQAIERYGIIRGGYKALRRLLRCHPLSDGGHDPV